MALKKTAGVVVAGAGAAGMMAAITAARAGAHVTLIEPNEKVGRKLYITGKGRCNVTNDCAQQDLMGAMTCNGKFLYSAFRRFTPRDTMDFFTALGVPLKVERGSRVFPCSDKAADIVDALFFELRRQGVALVQDRLTALCIGGGGVYGVETEQSGRMGADCVVLCTGGASYPRTGSTGDGYRLARSAGHTVTALRGSLVPLTSDHPDCARLQGLSLRNVGLTMKNGRGKSVYREQGELLFTHFGLSGPLILSASAHMDVSRESYTAHIDLKPALDEAALDARLLRELQQRANQTYGSVLGALVPRSMVPVMVRRTGIPSDTKAHDIRREQRRALLEALKDFAVPVLGTRPVEEAVVTSGGVAVSEVNPNTMESRLVPGLYFAGELLDVDAYTGGYNLQIAWSTGHAAGEAAAARQQERSVEP